MRDPKEAELIEEVEEWQVRLDRMKAEVAKGPPYEMGVLLGMTMCSSHLRTSKRELDEYRCGIVRSC